MESQQVREILEQQRQSLIEAFEKEYNILLDDYIKLQAKYDEIKRDRDILSRAYNQLMDLRMAECVE